MAGADGIPFFHMFFLEDMDSSAGPPMAMDTEVWSRMPFDVLEKVLLRLPLAAQARCQVVCKAVRSYLSSHRLQRERASLGVSGGRLPIYSLVRSEAIMSKAHLHSCSDLRVPYKVHKLSLSFVPQEFRLSNLQYFGKGVLFLVNGVFNSNGLRVGHRICIVNPLNQTWRRLPDLVVESISQTHRDPLKHVSLMREEEGVFQVFVLHIFQHMSACLRTDPCYASVSTYSSRTCRWESKLITYPRSFHPSALSELDCVVVGQEYIYALRKTTGDYLERTTEVFRASNGEHVRTLVPPVPFTTLDGYRPSGYKLGLLQLEQGECMVAVLDMFDTCTIVGLPDRDAQHWDDVAALPRDVAMKMVPKLDPTDFDYELLCHTSDEHRGWPKQFHFPHYMAEVLLMDVQVAGTSLIISLDVDSYPQVVVYDYILGTWKIVLSCFLSGENSHAHDQGPWERDQLPWEQVLHRYNEYGGITFLEARPSLRLGMMDCPPESEKLALSLNTKDG